MALSPATTYEYLDVTHTANATEFRSAWQKKNLLVEDCFQELDKRWKGGRRYYNDLFASPKIDLAVLPPYSLFIQFTFTLSQPYISHDEQDFYIIDNPVRKDKIFGLPYIASTSWKGSLRAALWQLKYKEKDPSIRRLFGNDKDAIKEFQAGRLYFYPTFFTSKSLEIINRQDRKLRSGKDPIPFESVPAGTNGVFTLLSIPFDIVSQDTQETRTQIGIDLEIVAKGLQAMFRTHGFGAKTNSGFGLARESLQNVRLEIRASEMPKPAEPLNSFDKLLTFATELKRTLAGAPKEGRHEQ
ncbi:MAG TPA: RAMP superfamily CRISPR-associated protein [Ktedonobacteraceae bacterium]|nr:RAMP superfamily CRISPR-associated protein [Ktedonobacteraceae bacterium]